MNIVDGLRCQYEGLPKRHGDRSEWSVSPDLDDTTGVVHDMLQIKISDEHAALRNRFNGEPVFSQVIDAFLKMDHGTRICEWMHAQHCALNYPIADGKLWFVGGGTGV